MKDDKTKEEKTLIKLYGDDALEKVLVEIRDLAKYSNVTFDKEFMGLGISFLNTHAKEISLGNEKECTIKTLVSKSFGEAAMYKYNLCGGEIN